MIYVRANTRLRNKISAVDYEEANADWMKMASNGVTPRASRTYFSSFVAYSDGALLSPQCAASRHE